MSKKNGENPFLFIVIIFGFIALLFGLFKKSSQESSKIEAKIKPKRNKFIKKIIIPLLILGFAIQIISFFIDKAEKNSNILKFFSPEYVKVNKALVTISNNKRLTRDDEGFVELSAIGRDSFKEKIKKSYPNQYIPYPLVTSIEFQKWAVFEGGLASAVIGFHIHEMTPTDTPYEIPVNEIENIIKERKDNNLLIVAGVVFCFGFLLQILSILINNKYHSSKFSITKDDLDDAITKIIKSNSH